MASIANLIARSASSVDGSILALGGSTNPSGWLYSSKDAVTWTAKTSPFGATKVNTAMVWASTLNLWVAVSNQDNRIATSPDLITWTLITTSSSTIFTDIAWSPLLSLFVATNDKTTGGNTVWTSPNGITWTSRVSNFGTVSAKRVVWSPALGIFVITGNYDKVATSPDGITWTVQSSSFDGTHHINAALRWVPEQSQFVIGDSYGYIATSPNGITWTQRTQNTAQAFTALGYSPVLNMLISFHNTGGYYTSINGGINWTGRTSPTLGSIGFKYVMWSTIINKFVAAGVSGQIALSPDGINWTLDTGTPFYANGYAQQLLEVL